MVLKRRKKPVKEKQMVKRPSNMWSSRLPYFKSEEAERLAYKKSAEIDPFEAKGYTSRYRYRDLLETKCNDRSPCPPLVLLYARMGLHRHNLLKGTNYELVCVRKYNKTIPIPCASSYYITSVAKDPSSSSSLIFHTGVNEEAYGRLVLTCYCARPRGTTDTPTKSEFYLPGDLPQCPPQNPFPSSNPFYLLKKSEWQDNAWISLYLELAVATTHRSRGDQDLSNLKIVKVVMDTTKDVNEERLNAKNAVFYIRYKDSCEARVGKNVDRIAVVKRAFNERTGCFSLVGQNLSSEIIPKNDKIRSVQKILNPGGYLVSGSACHSKSLA